MSTYTSEPGTRLGGRYRLEDRLAAAAGWSAWKAIDEILARPVSVITFAAGFPRLEQVVTAARAASRLTDTRLTQVFDVEDSWEHGYIVLEWPVGDTLGDLLAAGSLEPLAAARIVAEVACRAVRRARRRPRAPVPAARCGPVDGRRRREGDRAWHRRRPDGHVGRGSRAGRYQGLGQVLYAALTGLWPGPDDVGLPPAPESEGRPRRPRQVRAGVPTVLDDMAGRALALPGRDDQAPFESPAEVAAALAAAIPPLQVPPGPRAASPGQPPGSRAGDPATAAPRPGAAPPGAGRLADPPPRRWPGGGSHSAGRWSRSRARAPPPCICCTSRRRPRLRTTRPGPARIRRLSTVVITPLSAHGFDALNPTRQRRREHRARQPTSCNGNPAGWATQQYYGARTSAT